MLDPNPLFCFKLIIGFHLQVKRYNQDGVSAAKEGVHNAIKNIDKGLFSKVFCKIVPDYLRGDEAYVLTVSLRMYGINFLFFRQLKA